MAGSTQWSWSSPRVFKFKGGVEGRGKGVRLAHLVPVPRGESLEAISLELQSDLDQESQWKRDVAGRTVAERFAEEAPEAGVDDLGAEWHDWLICDLLLEEAKLNLDPLES